MSTKVVDSAWIVSETTSLSALEIAPGGSISAEEGKSITLSVNGVGQNIAPGKYEGDIVLTITEQVPLHFQALTHMLRSAITIDGGKYIPEKSVPAAYKGSVGDGKAENVEIKDNQEQFNGVTILGDGEYLIENLKIDANGFGGNDFCGYGALLMAGGKSKVTVNNADITARGVVRNTVFGGGDCVLTVNNSKIAAFDGKLPDDYVDNIMPGSMFAVPWMLGLKGNCRATNLADNGVAYYNNCELRSEGWGVMSTDGVVVSRLNIKDSLIEITGKSGYGAFSIGDCIDTFDGCTFNIPDYALIMANDTASGTFTGKSVVNSKRFGVMSFRNKGGKLIVNDGSVFNTEKASFLIKGCAPMIECDGAELNTKSGVIIQFYNTDDPGNPAGYYCDPTEDDKLNPAHDKTVAKEAVDLIAKFSNMTINGSFYNGMTDVQGDTGPKMQMGPPPGEGGGAGGPGGPGGPGGAPGGPGGPGGPGPGGNAPEIPGAKNMSLQFVNCTVNGLITACKTLHRVPKIAKENNDQLGEVDNTPQSAVNNGVIASFDEKSVWNVAGTSYLTSLTLADGAVLAAPAGKSLKLTVSGAEQTVAPGKYEGDIVVSIA